jgi:hypothetical protein
MKHEITEERPESRACWERLEEWARARVQEFVQALLEEEVTELLGRSKLGTTRGVGGRHGVSERIWETAASDNAQRLNHLSCGLAQASNTGDVREPDSSTEQTPFLLTPCLPRDHRFSICSGLARCAKRGPLEGFSYLLPIPVELNVIRLDSSMKCSCNWSHVLYIGVNLCIVPQLLTLI